MLLIRLLSAFVAAVLYVSAPSFGSADRPQGMADSVQYYTDVSQLLALRLYTMTKWNSLEIHSDQSRLILRPNGPTALGLGFNYKSLGLGLAVGLPKSQGSIDRYGKTRRFDVQANVYGKKIGIDGFLQIYRGYYNSNPNDLMEWEDEILPQIPDMRILSLGGSAFYIFNDKTFSYKAAFVRNQIQRKSAGSPLVGLFVYHDLADTPNGFIPIEYPDSIRNAFNLKAFKATMIGILAGYMHTFVMWDDFFFNITVMPGIGYQRLDLKSLDDTQSTKNSLALQALGRASLGYEHRSFYLGINGSVILRNFEYRDFEFDLATEQLRVFVGKRLDVSKKK